MFAQRSVRDTQRRLQKGTTAISNPTNKFQSQKKVKHLEKLRIACISHISKDTQRFQKDIENTSKGFRS